MTKLCGRAILFFITLVAFFVPAVAQDVIEMPRSTPRVFTVPRPIGYLIQLNPEIALAAPLPQRNRETYNFVLFGQGAGTTHIMALDQQGEEMFYTTVIVNERAEEVGLRLTSFW